MNRFPNDNGKYGLLNTEFPPPKTILGMPPPLHEKEMKKSQRNHENKL